MKSSISSITKDLTELNLTRESTQEIFFKGTRDNKDLIVYKDKISGVIFIKDYFVGEVEYIEGNYRKNSLKNNKIINKKLLNKYIPLADFGRTEDLERRIDCFKSFYICKDILDYGCGHGDFLLKTNSYTKSSKGIELQKDFRDGLVSSGIDCFKDLDKIMNESLDTIFLFHVFEHHNEPRKILKSLFKKLRIGGRLILEVPHAGDFLLSTLKEDSFIKFTLNSQHLILHTRNSLNAFLSDANFSDIVIKGIQRYSLSNHLGWLKNKEPGGHMSNLAFLDNDALKEIYEKSLSSIESTDTLISIATKK